MTPVTEIVTLLKIFFSPFFIINVCQYFNGQLTFLYVTVVWKSNSVTQFGDENNGKKRHIKVRKWTLRIIFIHKIFTIYQWSKYIGKWSGGPQRIQGRALVWGPGGQKPSAKKRFSILGQFFLASQTICWPPFSYQEMH